MFYCFNGPAVNMRYAYAYPNFDEIRLFILHRARGPDDILIECLPRKGSTIVSSSEKIACIPGKMYNSCLPPNHILSNYTCFVLGINTSGLIRLVSVM